MRPLAVIAVFLLAFSMPAQPALDTKAVDKLMKSTMKAWQIPGAAVAIVRNDRVVYAQGYGTTDLSGSERVTADTLFQIASTSKAFTTAALAMLVADGKLSWDDPVRKHIPYFRLDDVCADSQVTIRDIVSHRTGVGRHDELWDNSPLTREEIVRAMGELRLAKPFRTTYQYHNMMFIAAGEVVSHVSGMPWDDFVRTRIFTPLEMTNTIITDAEWKTAKHAEGHRFDAKTSQVLPQRPIETATLGSAGAIKSSAREMGNWLRFQLANGAFNLYQLTDSKQLEETKTPHTPIRIENLTRDLNPETHVMSYGLGWVVQDYRGELLISHSGALNGFRTHVDLLPKRASGFVVMANIGRGYALVALRNALADMLSGKSGRDWNAYYLMLDRRVDETAMRAKEERLAKRAPNAAPALPLESYSGDYESRSHGKAKLSVADGRLRLEWSRASIPLVHLEYDTFLAESEADDIDEEVTFAFDPKRQVATFTMFGVTFRKK